MRIARDQIGAETLQLSDTVPRLPLVWAKPVNSRLKSFLYISLIIFGITGMPLAYLNKFGPEQVSSRTNQVQVVVDSASEDHSARPFSPKSIADSSFHRFRSPTNSYKDINLQSAIEKLGREQVSPVFRERVLFPSSSGACQRYPSLSLMPCL